MDGPLPNPVPQGGTPQQTRPSLFFAYVLWWFLGTAGAHRFYLQRPRSGLAMLALLVLTIVAKIYRLPFADISLLVLGIWWIVDAFLVYRWSTSERRSLEELRAEQLRKHRDETGQS